jgi:hypothetical protein
MLCERAVSGQDKLCGGVNCGHAFVLLCELVQNVFLIDIVFIMVYNYCVILNLSDIKNRKFYNSILINKRKPGFSAANATV